MGWTDSSQDQESHFVSHERPPGVEGQQHTTGLDWIGYFLEYQNMGIEVYICIA